MDGPNAISSASFAALGGTAVVAVADPEALDDAVVAAGVIVDRFDLACSSFRGDSELAAVNSSAGKPSRSAICSSTRSRRRCAARV